MGARGESTLQARDREVRILFTNRALAEAEGAIGKSIIGVAQGFVDGTSGISELAQLLRVGMEAARRDAREGGRAITLGEAYDVLDAVGFAAAGQAVFGAVSEVLSYSGEADESPNP